jgi:hypothetical protein
MIFSYMGNYGARIIQVHSDRQGTIICKTKIYEGRKYTKSLHFARLMLDRNQ